MTSTYITQDILQMTEYACNQSHKSLVTDLSYKIDILILKGAADCSILILTRHFIQDPTTKVENRIPGYSVIGITCVGM